MLQIATSVLHPYPLIWRTDPALKLPDLPPEVAPLPDESPEDLEARRAKREAEVATLTEAFDLAWVRAIETRQWDEIRKPNGTPTVFWCRPIPGARFRAFLDFVGRDDGGIGGHQRTSLAFRLGVTRIENFPAGFKVELVDHLDSRGEPTGLGKVLSEDVIDVLDNADPNIVTVLGAAILKNRLSPPPL